jgi:hypothetical protein
MRSPNEEGGLALKNKQGQSLAELIELAAAEIQSDLGKKGSARRQLLGHEPHLLRMLELGLPLRKQVEILALATPAINTSAMSLRHFYMSDLPEPWAKYLADAGRGKKENRAIREASGPSSEPDEGLTP